MAPFASVTVIDWPRSFCRMPNIGTMMATTRTRNGAPPPPPGACRKKQTK